MSSPSAKKQKTTKAKKDDNSDDAAFLKKISNDPVRAFEVLSDFHERLNKKCPKEAKAAILKARKVLGIDDCNKTLDGSWSLVPGNSYSKEKLEQREPVGSVSFSVKDGKISIDDCEVGGLIMEDLSHSESCSIFDKQLSFNFGFHICGCTETAYFSVTVAQHTPEGGLIIMKHPRGDSWNKNQ